uniref:Polycomb complex protein BMI-1 n=1 Tax=Lygus hesperus TaxID=30085 RepID=A0A146LLX1_LYGHE
MGPRRTLVREVNPHLICVLCRGYFIEATTITECLHSFCRSCLVKYLETSKFCPICDVQLHKNNPLLSVRCDPTLQQLVYKLIPGLYANEMARRRKYYSELGGPSSDPEASEYPVGDAYFAPEDSISLSLEFTNATPGNKEDESCGSDIEDSPVDKQGVLHRRYLQCPAAVTMSHLQKFLRMKYGFSHEVKVDIIYDGEVLTDEFSLMDVAYTFNWKRTAPMRFKFCLLQKSEVPPKSFGIEKTKKPVELKDSEEVVKKPTAEAKVFAFANNVVKTSNPPIQKNTSSQITTTNYATTSSTKTEEEPKALPVQPKVQAAQSKAHPSQPKVQPGQPKVQSVQLKVQLEQPKLQPESKDRESREVKALKEAAKDMYTFREDKEFKAAGSKEGKELKALKDSKPRYNNLSCNNNDKSVEKTSCYTPLKRTIVEKLEEPPVETKRLKIVLDPLPSVQKTENKKTITVKPEIVNKEMEPRPTSTKNGIEKRPDSKKESSLAVQKAREIEVPKKEVNKVKTKEPVPDITDDIEEEEEEPNYMDDIIQEDDYDEEEEEDRLHISPSEEDMIIEEKVDQPEEEPMEVLESQIEPESVPEPEPEPIKYSRSEEKRKEKKKNKKAKHHHHRHHDRKRDSPPIATILHSPDDLKLKFKLTNTNSKPKYTILDNNDSKKDHNSHSSPKHQEKYIEKESKHKLKETYEEPQKKISPPVINNNYNNLNNNNSFHMKNNQNESATPQPIVESGSKERSVQLKISKQKVVRPPSPKVSPPLQKPNPVVAPMMNSVPKSCPSPKQIPIMKQNGTTALKPETIKLPPSSITVSKITAAEKAQMEQQKLLMNRNNSLGLDSKRPSLEIMLVNAPKKAGEGCGETKPVEVKKVIRPTPPSIPLSRLKNFGPKGSPPPLVLANKSLSGNDENGALDLSGKSSRKSPEVDSMRNLVMLSNTAVQERMMSSLEPLKIPIPPIASMGMKSGYQPQPRTMKPVPNQTVRQIPNPSALMFRQHALNSQRSVPQSLPINSLRKMETMAKNINIEKVAAGLSVKAAVEAGYQPK